MSSSEQNQESKTSGAAKEDEDVKVSVTTYLQYYQNSVEQRPIPCFDLCDDIYEGHDGGGAYELYITAGDLVEGSEQRHQTATFQELFTWYELKDGDIVYPCFLEKGANGSIQRLEHFDIPVEGEETTIIKIDLDGTESVHCLFHLSVGIAYYSEFACCCCVFMN